MQVFFFGFSLSVIINLTLAYYYRHDPILKSAPRWVKIPTWLRYLAVGGLLTGLAGVNPNITNIPRLILFALLTLPAITDLETRYLPPDTYTYSAVLVSLATHAYLAGFDGFTAALLAEILCFVVATLSVVMLRATDPGDIKVMMQFGAASGSLDVVVTALLCQSLLLLIGALGYWLYRRRWPRSLPLASLLWAGLGLAWGIGL